ncbi:MAG: hypothetical protein ACNA8W_25145, partial [Bradymonadaceae bacterium]
SEGCDHTCAFCAIPLMRGKFRSTPMGLLVREARELERALIPLFEEQERLVRIGDRGPQHRVLVLRERLIQEIGLPAKDPRAMENDLALGFSELRIGASPDAVLDRIDYICKGEQKHGTTDLLARAFTLSALCHQQKGDLPGAHELGERALDWARHSQSLRDVVRTLHILGAGEFLRGHLEQAEDYLIESRELSVQADDRFLELASLTTLAWVAQARGQNERAAALFENVIEESRKAGHRNLEAECLNGTGEVARFGGDAHRARICYKGYGALSRELNHAEGLAIATLNMALVELMARRHEHASRYLEEATRLYETHSIKRSRHTIELARLALAAGTGDGKVFEEIFQRYEPGWPEASSLSRDHPWLLEIAAGSLHEAGEEEQEERVRRLARELWSRLGDE